MDTKTKTVIKTDGHDIHCEEDATEIASRVNEARQKNLLFYANRVYTRQKSALEEGPSRTAIETVGTHICPWSVRQIFPRHP